MPAAGPPDTQRQVLTVTVLLSGLTVETAVHHFYAVASLDAPGPGFPLLG